VRVRCAISHAIDRQAIVDAVFVKGEPTPAISRGVPEWSPRIDELGAGAKYYQVRPKGSQTPAGGSRLPKGLKTQLHVTSGYGRDLRSIPSSWPQRYLKDVGIEAELQLQEYGAYMATTFSGKFEAWPWAPSPSSGNHIAPCTV